jgi:hypothetical protein
MEKEKLLVSFSGGETSAFMAQWLWKNKQHVFDMAFVFANTGQENEQTLEFVEKCSKHFGFDVFWVEGKFNKTHGIGTKSKIVDFNSADRNGKRFEEMISIYGIPNQANPQCTRELKLAPINHFTRNVLKWKKFSTAIGIRLDESDRINSKGKERKIIYPLISNKFIPSTKQDVNKFWESMPFRLELKGYQGNCKWCWKKSVKKLQKIAFENPEHFDFPSKMEEKYGNFFPQQRLENFINEGKEIPKDITFFRGHLSAKDILKSAYPHKISEDSRYLGIQLRIDDIDLVGGEGCEIYSECGS